MKILDSDLLLGSMSEGEGMKRILSTIILVSVFLSGVLCGSDIKLIEPANAIRMIGKQGVIFVSGEQRDAFRREHIVGSVNIPASYLCHQEPEGGRSCIPPRSCKKEAEKYLRDKGIKNDQMIIVYDNHLGLGATAIYRFFQSVGQKELVLLHGGLKSIKALDPNNIVFDKLKSKQKTIKDEAKKAENTEERQELDEKVKSIEAKMKYLEPQLLVISSKEKKRKQSNYNVDAERFNRVNIANKVEVKKAVNDIQKFGNKSKFAIIDSRSISEISDTSDSGYIPGAALIDWKCTLDAREEKVLNSFEVLKELLENSGISKKQTIYLYGKSDADCSSCLAVALHYLGYGHVKVFTSGWESWKSDVSLPFWRYSRDANGSTRG